MRLHKQSLHRQSLLGHALRAASCATVALTLLLGVATPSYGTSVAVFGDNFTDNFISSLPGYTATLVTDGQVATPGFLNSFDAFYMTRDGSSFGSGLSVSAAAAVAAYVGASGNVVLLNADFADALSSSAFLQTLTANAVAFATASGHGYIGEFNGSVSALTSNSSGFNPIGLIPGSAGPLGGGNGGSSTNMNLAPAGVGHPVLQGLTLPFNPEDVDYGSSLSGVDSTLVLSTFDGGNPAVIARSGASVCGNGTAESGEECDAGPANGTSTSCCTSSCTYRASGEVCRPAAGACDLAETCSGSSGTCPAVDSKSTAECRPSAGVCDPAESCDGGNDDCPADAKQPSGTPCGDPSTTECDNADSCNGAGTCLVNHVADLTPCHGGNNNTCLNACATGVCAPHTFANCCGNGTLDAGEICDDGNQVSGDQCSAACAPEIDHFQCYNTRAIERQPPIPQHVLVDQFHTINAVIGAAKGLCNPASKNGEDPSAPAHPDHLERYPITTSPRRDLALLLPMYNVKVVDQFGTHQLNVIRPTHLLVPTAKELSSPPAAPANPSVDHFTCYSVRPAAGQPRFQPRPNVTVDDQFGRTTVTVYRPTRLCLPTNKFDEDPGAENHLAHLLCYRVRGRFRSPGRVYTNNQFGPGQLYVRFPQELCVPAAKYLQ